MGFWRLVRTCSISGCSQHYFLFWWDEKLIRIFRHIGAKVALTPYR